jgi:hypothetical protein
MSQLHLLAASLLADDESKKSGPIGLAVILVLCIACYFLFKSMSKHMRKVREEFPGAEKPDGAGRSWPRDESAPAADQAPAENGEASAENHPSS